MREVNIDGRSPAGEEMQFASHSGTDGIPYRTFIENMPAPLMQGVLLPGFLVPGPLGKMFDCVGEYPSLYPGTRLLGCSIVDFFKHPGDAKQIGRFECTHIAQQVLDIRQIRDNAPVTENS